MNSTDKTRGELRDEVTLFLDEKTDLVKSSQGDVFILKLTYFRNLTN